MKIQIWKRKNKSKKKNNIYIRYRYSQSKAYVESLNLWEWTEPKNKEEINHNEEVKKAFEEIKRRKQDDYDNKRFVIEPRNERKAYFKNLFFEYCYKNNSNAIYKLLLLCDPKISSLKINQVVNGVYLRSLKEKWEDLEKNTKIKRSTLIKYWESFKSSLIKANKYRLCEYPNISNIKPSVIIKKKNFYTEKELKQLDKTEPDKWKDIKNAFFFSCYTGLTLGDLYKIKWKNINTRKIQNKTVYYFKIYNELKNIEIKNSFPVIAMKYLGERKNEEKKIFDLPEKISNRSKVFKLWKKKSGISNNKTFHDSRHTYAYQMYRETNNIYLVAEALGHKSIETTKKYYPGMENNDFYKNANYIENALKRASENQDNKKFVRIKKGIFKQGNLLSYKKIKDTL